MRQPAEPGEATIETGDGVAYGTGDTGNEAGEPHPVMSAADTLSAASKPSSDAPVGRLISIAGSKAKVLLNKPGDQQNSAEYLCPHIGTVLTVDTGVAVVLCLITGMSVPNTAVDREQTDTRVLEVDLMGELVREDDGYLRTFRRGCSIYPRLGDSLYVASHTVLEKAYHFSSHNSVMIGAIHQDPSIPAVVKIDELLGKHFAIVGSTGSGKSCTVALILRQILQHHRNAHIVLLDPHNEYDACFTETAELVRLGDLSLPFWFLNFEELIEILIGNPKERPEEVEILRDLIPLAKRRFASSRDQSAASALRRGGGGRAKYTVDVPVPYRISDLTSLIEVEMGRLENKRELTPFKRLKSRIDTITQDPRFDFMFGSLTIHDNLSSILKRLFRIPVAGKPITVIQLMGLPSEIVNVVVSVLARLAFDLALWSDGRMPITFVCEEAHRYVPRDVTVGFEPTKRAISRIAKEGRKYGVSLCVVSQRPGDLDPTILSQCSTLFTMRLSNERDQDIIRRALPDAAESLIDFLPSLGTRETIVFGEGVSLPSHILLSELPASTLPRGNTAVFSEAWTNDITDHTFVDEVVSRWRVIGQLPDDSLEAADLSEEREAVAAQVHADPASPVQQSAEPQQPPPSQPSQPSLRKPGGLLDPGAQHGAPREQARPQPQRQPPPPQQFQAPSQPQPQSPSPSQLREQLQSQSQRSGSITAALAERFKKFNS